ncbi:hypothetical protein BGW36DRAFT_375243 [Talaromyces proteolyticus]|uniref:Uncharacterized protein n=1 Tax=Talaromyces proteolyticus TaxID=1131652 RepID=A0AAD4KWT4_9EURO|nr:uncharacterized protein BGW36DRAFT_375243 [Talaromyces proteolyticus]KAH8700923.1 hypothetical protein BGW36DRAFT_375243 [Talaromyces proteolyticus]
MNKCQNLFDDLTRSQIPKENLIVLVVSCGSFQQVWNYLLFSQVLRPYPASSYEFLGLADS